MRGGDTHTHRTRVLSMRFMRWGSYLPQLGALAEGTSQSTHTHTQHAHGTHTSCGGEGDCRKFRSSLLVPQNTKRGAYAFYVISALRFIFGNLGPMLRICRGTDTHARPQTASRGRMQLLHREEAKRTKRRKVPRMDGCTGKPAQSEPPTRFPRRPD
jgi:hypothetical protein